MFDISNARFAFLDLETTGLSPWFGDRICEVGIVVTEGKRIKEQVQQLANPEHPLSPGAASTNGLSDDDLESAPLFAEIADEVLGWLKGAVVICHNAQFDIQFLESEFKRLGRVIQFSNVVDTLLLARQYYEFPSYSLQSIAESFQLPLTIKHRALDGALASRSINSSTNHSMITSVFITRRCGPTKGFNCQLNWAKRSTATSGCSSNI